MGTRSPALSAFWVPRHMLTFAIAAPAPGLCCTPARRAAEEASLLSLMVFWESVPLDSHACFIGFLLAVYYQGNFHANGVIVW